MYSALRIATWLFSEIKALVVSMSYCRVKSNFISVYAYGAQSSVSFLTVLGDKRS